jgi:hypothetical protein
MVEWLSERYVAGIIGRLAWGIKPQGTSAGWGEGFRVKCSPKTGRAVKVLFRLDEDGSGVKAWHGFDGGFLRSSNARWRWRRFAPFPSGEMSEAEKRARWRKKLDLK